MDDTLKEYIEKDLFSELKWLLCAAAQWDIHDKLIGEPPRVAKIAEPCPHLKVYAMDSAFLHARSLYEFFTATDNAITKNEKRGLKRLTWRDYSRSARQESARYKTVMIPLHGRVMHLDRDRTGYEEIKKEVVNLASDILDVWGRFSKSPGLEEYVGLLDQIRGCVIAEVLMFADRYKELGYESPFS
jgi:hypothetical protein